jgi:sugar O-acyltransferase (sialic acid O-acetyltransferase NeuD family)
LILIGGGGHCRACIDVIEQTPDFEVAGIVDLPEKLHQKVLGYEIVGTDEDLPHMAKEYECFLITLGQIKSADRRALLFNSLEKLGARFPVIVSPHAYLSKHARVGEGTIIMHHAMVNAGAKIGKNCIINSKSLIEHDAIIGDHCHISTSAVINGGAEVQDGTFMGSHSVTREQTRIGKNSVIGCNVKVMENLPPETIVK